MTLRVPETMPCNRANGRGQLCFLPAHHAGPCRYPILNPDPNAAIQRDACGCREAKLAKEVAELRASLNEACAHMDFLSASLVRMESERDRLRELLNRWTKGPSVTLIVGMDRHDCKVIDVGHADVCLMVECPDVAAVVAERDRFAKLCDDCLDKTADGKFSVECENLYCPECFEPVKRDYLLNYCWNCPNPDDYNAVPLPLPDGLCYSTPEAAKAAKKGGPRD